LEEQIKVERSSTEKKIAVLKAEMENLQSDIDQLNEKVKGIQQKIDQGQAKIEELSTLRNRRFLNRNKMESQVNQFLNGWCRFVAHSEDRTTDVSAQIDRIKQVACETLNSYYEGLQNYSSQS
jgi:predicted  nucleic acid-binding Zn-ribbon protein